MSVHDFYVVKGGGTDMKTRVANKAMTAIMAGIIGLGTIVPTMAIAADNEASTGAQSGTGQTALNMIVNLDPEAEVDDSDERFGFTVPTSINYVVKADGSLVGPTNAHIENGSAFPIHVSSLQVTAQTPFNIVSNVAEATGSNVVDFVIGPSTEQLNGASYLSKAAVTTPSKWNMIASTSDDSDQLALVTSGHVKNITSDITSTQKFGSIHWYFQAGAAS